MKMITEKMQQKNEHATKKEAQERDVGVGKIPRISHTQRSTYTHEKEFGGEEASLYRYRGL